jgi:hypothetical protein
MHICKPPPQQKLGTTWPAKPAEQSKIIKGALK